MYIFEDDGQQAKEALIFSQIKRVIYLPFYFSPGGKSSYQNMTDANFLNKSVSLDYSFTCAHTLIFSKAYVTLYNIQLMPFADEAKGDFGKGKLQLACVLRYQLQCYTCNEPQNHNI